MTISDVAAVTAVCYAAVGCGAQSVSSVRRDEWQRENAMGFTVVYRPDDRAAAHGALAHAAAARGELETTFRLTYGRSFDIVIYSDRRSMFDRWREAWKQPAFQGQCWMVAAGWADELSLLSPRLWTSEACGHNGADSAHVRLIVVHEMVHVLHAQSNRTYGALQLSAPWLPEGLASYASGQWAREYAARARDAVRVGGLPSTFEAVWATSAGYAIAGATIAYLAATRGDTVLRDLLGAENWSAALAMLDTTDAALFTAVRAWLVTS